MRPLHWTSALLALSTFGPTTVRAACTADAAEPDDGCYLSSAVLHGGETIVHSFCDDAADWVRLNACSGRSYTLQTSNLDSSADTVLELYAPDCTTLLASNDNGGGGNASLLAWTAPDDGAYHVRILQANGTLGDNRGYDLALTGDTSSCGEWVVGYEDPVLTSISMLRPTADGGFIAAGTGPGIGDEQAYAWIGRLDAAGRIVWKNKIRAADAVYRGGPAVQTSDGGFLLAGSRDLEDGNGADAWLVRFDGAGAILWQRSYGGSSGDGVSDLQLTTDGGFVLAGQTYSFGGRSDLDAWVLRLDAAGSVVWSKRYGGTSEDEARGIRQTSDGGFVFAGGSGSQDAWVVRLDASGNMVWQRTIGGPDFEILNAPVLTFGDGMFVTGQTEAASRSVWVLRLEASGNILWQKAYYGPQSGGTPAYRASDGGLVVASQLFYEPFGPFTGWLLKLDDSGTVLWQREVSTVKGLDVSVFETPDGGSAVLGYNEDHGSIFRTGPDGRIAGCALLHDKTGATTVTTLPSTSSGGSAHNLSVTVMATTATVSASAWRVYPICSCSPAPYAGMLGAEPNSAGGSGVHLSWPAGGVPLSFDVVRGDVSTLHATLGDFTAALNTMSPSACLAADTTALLADDPPGLPPAGAGFFYVLRAGSASCIGSYDTGSTRQVGSRDREVALASTACP